jgi:hypothetical protein
VDSALLEHAELSSGEVSIHDLYREFATLEAQGKLMASDMEKRAWVYARNALPTEMVEDPRDSWKKLTRVCIEGTYGNMNKSMITNLRTIGWKYYTHLVILKLDNLCELSGVLNFKDLIRLRSLTVHIRKGGISASKFSIEGLEGLKSLTYFKVCVVWDDSEAYVGQLPAALTVLEVDVVAVFERDVLALCTNLVSLKLRLVNTSDLDLRSCSSLQKVELTCIKGLEIVRLGPSLQSLHISSCRELVRVCGLDRLVGLLSLVLMHNRRLSKLPNLTGLKCLHTLKCNQLEIEEVPGLDGLVGLKSLSLRHCQRLSKLPRLTGLQYLEVIDAYGNENLTSLQGFGDLRALTTINLSCCAWLRRLPDMSNLTNLKVLNLCHTRVELHEEDIHMLEGLQALEPVMVGTFFHPYGLDFKRHKIMYCLSRDARGYQGWQTWKEWGWREKDLHYPSVAGHLVGEGLKLQDMKNIWGLIPGPATEFLGIDRHEISIW